MTGAARVRRRGSGRPSRLALRLAGASVLVAAASLFTVLLTTERVVRGNAEAASFANLDAKAEIALGSRPRDDSPAETVRWAMGLAAFEADPDRRTPTAAERRVTVIARDGAVIADSHENPAIMDNHADRPEVLAAFASGYGRSQRFSDTRGEELSYVAVQLPWNPDAVLRLSEPVVRIEETIRAILTPVALVTLLAALTAAGVAWWYARRFADRVDRLVQFSERVAQGDFRPESAAPGVDELDTLLASLNRTADALRRSFESLTAEKNQGATILSSMLEGVAVLDRDLRIEYLNGAFRELLSLPGGSWREYRGREARRVLEAKRLMKMVKAAMRGKSKEREVPVAGRDILARAAPVRARDPAFEGEGPLAPRDRSRAPVGAVLVLMDVTRLRALERVRRDFVANLSHELKTPLTAIRGFSETLLDSDLEEGPERRRFLEIIREHVIRLSRLTDDLLRLARIEAGKLEADPSPTNLQRLLETVGESARVKAGRRDLRVHRFGGDPRVWTDPTLVTEILENLVANAIQYSEDGTRVDLLIERKRRVFRIAVVDQGVGIPKRHRSRIFERFYRVDPARSRAVGGTGLGLAIARHLAELLGGAIRLRSAPRRGSRFWLELPARTKNLPASDEMELEAPSERIHADELRLDAVADPEPSAARARA